MMNGVDPHVAPSSDSTEPVVLPALTIKKQKCLTR